MDSSDEPVYSLTARSEREAVRGIAVGDLKVSPDSITRLDPVVEDRLRRRLKYSLWALSFLAAVILILALRRASFFEAENLRQNKPVVQDVHWPFTDGSVASTSDIRTLLVGDLGCVYTIPLGNADRKDKTNPLPGESLYDYRRELGLLKMTTRKARNATTNVVDTESILCLHRKSAFWLEPRFISPSSVAMPAETLLVLGKDSADGTMYRLIMALIVSEDDGFTSLSLQSSPLDDNRIVVTSETGGIVAIYAGIGDDPYALLSEGAAMASQLAASSYTTKALYLSTSPLAVESKFHLLSRLPDFARYLGWCTWNAYYTKYDGAAILSGVDKLHSAQVPIRWMILDDGWQHTTNDTAIQQKLSVRRLQRLAKLDSSPTKFGPDGVPLVKNNKKQKQQPLVSLNETIRQLKLSREKGGKGLDYVLAWHAISGYWLGLDKVVEPTESALDLPNVSLYFPQFSTGLMNSSTTSNETQKEPSIKLGIGIPENATEFYTRYYTYMRQVGIDGVKADVQAILGSLRPFPSVMPVDAEYQHRHQVAARMHEALAGSAERSFHYHANALPIIHCMSHAPEILYRIPSLYGSGLDRPLPLLRASEDFFPNIPSSHGPMIAAATFNSLILGKLSVPDWDQFQTVMADSDFAPGHVVAKFHAVARSISGGPVYISDIPGSVNSTLLESLVCLDGSILPCANVAIPTRSSLLRDPLVKGSGPVVVWNTNGIPDAFPSSGVFGIFQAAESSKTKTVVEVHARDIEPFSTPLHEAANFIGFSYNKQELWLLEGARASMPISFPGENLWSDVVSIIPLTPVRAGDKTWEIAPLGYVGMFNSAGAILKSQVTTFAGKERILMSIRGCGEFAAVVRMKSSNNTILTPAVSFTVRIDAATFTRGTVSFDSAVPFHGLEKEGFQYISLEVDCISVKSGTERHLSLELLHGG